MMARNLSLAALTAAGLLAATATSAPTAELRTGGLQIVPNDVVSIASEEVRISPTEIRIVYRYRNDTAVEQNLLMSFSLPSLNASFRAVDLDLPNPDSANFVDFLVAADGVALEPELVETASVLGVDRTAEISSLGLPLNPLDAIDIPADRRAAAGELFAGAVPTWEYQPTFYWTQAFAPNAETVIEQRYTPVMGGGAWGAAPLQSNRFRQIYCIGDTFAAQVETEALRHRLMAHTIGYVLSPPNKWEGPIERFRLVVDKGEETALVSFCGEGVRRVDLTSFEMTAQHLFATGQLDIVIFYPAPQ